MRIATFLLVLALAPVHWAWAAEDIEASRKSLAQVRARIQAVQQQLKQDRGEQDALQDQLRELESEISQTQQQLRAARERMAGQQQKLADTRRLQLKAQDDLERQRRALAQQLRAAHRMGQSGPLKLLLNQEDVQKVGRVLAYYDYLNKARGARIAGMATQLKMIADIGRQLGVEAEALEVAEAEHEAVLNTLKTRRGQRSETIQRLAERIADAVSELRQLESDEQRVQNLIETLKDALADIPVDAGVDKPFAQLRGKLPWPLRGKLLAKFGQAKAGGKFNWRGYWIEAPEGTAVRASAAGRIAYVGWMQRYGLIAIVEHTGGYYSLYGHLQRVPRSEGEWVKAGEALALAGNTGGYEKSGLYFEIRKGREPVNPADWLAK